MKGDVAILIGLLGIWAGVSELRKALKTGTFYGWCGTRFSAEPDTVMYWVSLLFRAVFILLAAAVVWIGIENIWN